MFDSRSIDSYSSSSASCEGRPSLSRKIPFHSSHFKRAQSLYEAALTLSQTLEYGQTLTPSLLRQAMSDAFGGDDTRGYWLWKEAYEASEAAIVLFIHRFSPGLQNHAKASARPDTTLLALIETLASLLPSQTRRSEEQLRFQQFSTPLPFALIAAQAAAITSEDTIL